MKNETYREIHITYNQGFSHGGPISLEVYDRLGNNLELVDSMNGLYNRSEAWSEAHARVRNRERYLIIDDTVDVEWIV